MDKFRRSIVIPEKDLDYTVYLPNGRTVLDYRYHCNWVKEGVAIDKIRIIKRK